MSIQTLDFLSFWAVENEKSRDTDRNDVSRLHMVPQSVSGSETSFRMSYEIVPV